MKELESSATGVLSSSHTDSSSDPPTAEDSDHMENLRFPDPLEIFPPASEDVSEPRVSQLSLFGPGVQSSSNGGRCLTFDFRLNIVLDY